MGKGGNNVTADLDEGRLGTHTHTHTHTHTELETERETRIEIDRYKQKI